MELSGRRRRVSSGGPRGPLLHVQTFGKENASVITQTPQVSPVKTAVYVDTPSSSGSGSGTYDRKALSELLRVSATTLKTTHEQLQHANQHIAELKAELSARQKTINFATQTETPELRSASDAASQTMPETACQEHQSALVPADKPKGTHKATRVKREGKMFASGAEFERIVSELIHLRLRVFELEHGERRGR